MKKLQNNHLGISLLIIALVFGFTQSKGQIFEAIHAETSKEFSADPETWERTYSLHIDSATQNGDTLDYHLANRINQDEIADFETDENTALECIGWGDCNENSGSTGFGVSVMSTTPGVFKFVNIAEDTLTLNFSQADSSIIYQNEDESYALVFDGETQEEIFDQEETVQAYKMVHHSNDGDEIDSPLHNFQLKIGSETGLIQFFQTDNFPTVERPLYLIGDLSQPESYRVLLSEEIYDFDIGDTIQIKRTETIGFPQSNAYFNTITYRTKIFLDRTVEPDSIRYEILNRSFTEEDTTLYEWIDEKIYPRFDTIAQIPFYSTRAGSNNAAYQEKISRVDFCGESKIKLEGNAIPYQFCADHDAWCAFDTNGPAGVYEYELAEGLGVYFEKFVDSDFNDYSSDVYEIIYFSKAGNSCGNQAVLSTEVYDKGKLGFSIFPNPAENQVTIQTETTTSLSGAIIKILDSSGRLQASHSWNGAVQNIDVSKLSPGLYFVQLIYSDRASGTTKLILQ
ncbi:MAG: T9SS type A sorting domain-containing protein [Cryomorphaceae bacterium]